LSRFAPFCAEHKQLAIGRDMLGSPTIRAALLADTPWLDVFRAGCGTSGAIDLRTVDRGLRQQPIPVSDMYALQCFEPMAPAITVRIAASSASMAIGVLTIDLVNPARRSGRLRNERGDARSRRRGP
jgi:hypothetical protein